MTILTLSGSERKPAGPGSPASCSDQDACQPRPVCWGRAIPGEEATSPDHVYAASQRLVAAGLSVIPIDAYEGSKAPDPRRLPRPHDAITGRPRASWSIFTLRRPQADELRQWREAIDGPYGLAVVGGAVSGGQYGLGLEVIDFDTAVLADPWMEAVERLAPGLVARLVRVQTPRPGLHVYYRCAHFGVSQKLACAAAVDASGRSIPTTLIEVKAEGGYCLIPPSPPRCHPSGRLYQYVDGSPPLTAVPTITPDERRWLLDAARSLNQWVVPKPSPRPQRGAGSPPKGSRPGDDYDARAKWSDVLTPHGWTVVGSSGEETRWCRPGKSDGVSATTNHGGSDLLHVFSSNAAPFEAERSYTKFAAYVLLMHGGDFTKAARALREQGYGAPRLVSGRG